MTEREQLEEVEREVAKVRQVLIPGAKEIIAANAEHQELLKLREAVAKIQDERNRLYDICVEAMNATAARVVTGVSIDLLSVLPGEVKGALTVARTRAYRSGLLRAARLADETHVPLLAQVLRSEACKWEGDEDGW
jgi:hypothetical protein